MTSAKVIAAVLTLTFPGLASTNSDAQIIPPYQLAFVNQPASFILNSNDSGIWFFQNGGGWFRDLFNCSCVEINAINDNSTLPQYQLYFNSTTTANAGRYIFYYPNASFKSPPTATLWLLDVAVETNVTGGGVAVWENVSVTCTLFFYISYISRETAFSAIIDIEADNSLRCRYTLTSNTSITNFSCHWNLPSRERHHCTASISHENVINSTAVLKTKTVTTEQYQLWDTVKTVQVNVSNQMTVNVWDVLNCSGNASPPANFTWEKQVTGNQWSVIQNGSVLNLATVQNAIFRCTASNVIRGIVYSKSSDTLIHEIFNNTSGKVTVITENSTATPTQSTSFSTSFSSSLNGASDSAIAIGVGVGVGVGLPLVILVVVCVVCACRRQTCKSLDEKKPAADNEYVDHPASQATDVSQSDNESRRFDDAHSYSLVIIDNGTVNNGNTETHYENTRATVSEAGSPTNLYDKLDVTIEDRMASAVYTAIKLDATTDDYMIPVAFTSIKHSLYVNDISNLQFSSDNSEATLVASADDVPLYDEVNVAGCH